MRVAIYARVSTTGMGQSPEMQLRELREYAARRGWDIAGEYVDNGISGAMDSRPELNRLMADAHKRRLDAVLVWKFDRFARSVAHLLRALETFKALGIEFCSFSEQMDTTTPTGKMILPCSAPWPSWNARLSLRGYGRGSGMPRPKGESSEGHASRQTRKRSPRCGVRGSLWRRSRSGQG
jgi:hypothetical protein